MRSSKYYPWIAVALLWGVALLNYMDRQMIATMRPAMQVDIEDLRQAANFGRLMAVFMWIYGAMSVFSGMVADRVNRKWLIIGSLFVWSAVTFAMGYARTFDQLYILRAIMGFSEALYIPGGLALIAELHSDKTRSLAVGIHMSGIYMGQAFGGFGSTVSAMYSWQHTFIFFGFVGMAYALVLMFFLKDSARPSASVTIKDSKTVGVFDGLFSLLKSFPFWIIVIYFAVPSLPGWAIKNWAPTLISENLDIDMSRAGPIATISISLSSLMGVLVGGIISDRWVQRNIRGRIYIGAIGLSLTVPAMLLMGFGTSLLPILSAAFLFGFGFGMFDTNNMPILCQFVRPDARATAYGFLNTAGIFSGALITDYLGKSTDAGNLGRDFAWLGAVVIIAVALQLIFLRPKPQITNVNA
jgi:ACS family D-galactonate transporter-like MFS transporter